MFFRKRGFLTTILLVAVFLTGCIGSSGNNNRGDFNFADDEVSLEQDNDGFDFSEDDVDEESNEEFNFSDEDINQEDDEDQQDPDSDEAPVDPSEFDWDQPLTGEDIEKNFDLDPCLIGSWVVDNESYLSILQDLAFAGGYDDSTFSGLEGTLMLTFSEDWTLILDGDLELEISNEEGSIVSDINQSAEGLYAVIYGSMYFVGDSETTATFMGQSDTAEGSVTDADYTCQGDTLTIDRLTYYRVD